MGSVMLIEKNMIPYRFEISLSSELFVFVIDYNPDFDFFTVDMQKNGVDIVLGEKIVYGIPLFQDIVDSRLPKVTITAYDEAGNETVVNWNNLNTTVFLFVEGDII